MSTDKDFIINDAELVKYTGDADDIVIPEGVKRINASAFSDYAEIGMISLPNSLLVDGMFVNSQGKYWRGWFDPVEYVIPGLEGKIVRKIKLPSNLKEIPENAAVEIGSRNLASPLEELLLPEGLEKIWSLENEKFKKIVIPSTVVEINSLYGLQPLEEVVFLGEKIKFGQQALGKIPNLKKVVFNGEKTSLSQGMFADSKILEISLPKKLKAIPAHCFQDSELDVIEIPDTVTSIGTNAFSPCKVNRIVLPKKLKKVSAYAFYQCATDVIEIPDTVTEIKEYAFSEHGQYKIVASEKILQLNRDAYENNLKKYR